jgi:hypothetical protein
MAKTVVNPIERLEILRQVGNTDYKGIGFFQSLKKIFETQGISGFFKGNSAVLIRILPFSAIEFYSFEFYKNIFIRGKEKKNMIFRTFICGALAGLNAITMTFPLDVARTRLAINTANSHIKENNIFQSLQNLYKTEGFKGLFRGYSICFVVYQINLGIHSVCGRQTNML